MADPVTWLAIATAVGATSSVVEGESAAAQAGNESDIAKANADMAAAQAGQAEDAKRKSNRELLARQRAAINESNLGEGGTGQLVQEQTGIAAELDALNIRYEGSLQRTNFLNQASAAKSAGKNARLNGYLSAAGQLLGGAAAVKGGTSAFSAFRSIKPYGATSTATRVGTGPVY